MAPGRVRFGLSFRLMVSWSCLKFSCVCVCKSQNTPALCTLCTHISSNIDRCKGDYFF
jgi:hypothetical protein